MSDDKWNYEVYDAAAEEEKREEERHKARKERAERMRKQKQKSMMIRRYGAIGGIAALSIIVLISVALKHGGKKDPRAIEPATDQVNLTEQSEQTQAAEDTEIPWNFETYRNENTADFPESVVSQYGILIDSDTGEVIAERGGDERIVPASMTKVMTVLVAAEHITPEQLDDKVKLTKEVADYSYVNDCSNTGFELDEPITVRDLFYGTIMPSGADSAVSLANYVAGSHEAFVELMNQKLEELGLSETSHFTNCVGLYDKEHYTTSRDMAVILKAATENEWCRQVLSQHIYTTEKTKQHPDGLRISNLFLRRIEDKETHSTVLCAKTGFVSQSGSCAASMAVDKNGKEYLLVTAGSTSSWRCIYDHVDIYTQFLPE